MEEKHQRHTHAETPGCDTRGRQDRDSECHRSIIWVIRLRMPSSSATPFQSITRLSSTRFSHITTARDRGPLTTTPPTASCTADDITVADMNWRACWSIAGVKAWFLNNPIRLSSSISLDEYNPANAFKSCWLRLS